MRVTLTFDSVHVKDMPIIVNCVADTADMTALHKSHPNTESRDVTVTRCGAEYYTVVKGPISRKQATRILTGLAEYAVRYGLTDPKEQP